MGRKGTAASQFEIDPNVIDDLTRAVQNLRLQRIRPGEGIIDEARRLAAQWKVGNESLLGSIASDLTLLLVGLAVALRRDHELVEWIRQHRSKELNKLISESLNAETQAVAPSSPNTQRMLTAKQRSERKQSKSNRTFTKSIEYQFGGGLEADDWRKLLSPLLGWTAYQNMLRQSQTCLDDIFAGKSVSRLKLMELFWLDRHHFAKPLRGLGKRRDYLAVTKIMDFLLKRRPRKKRDKSKPGPAPRRPWLNEDAVRVRVFREIVARIESLLMDEKCCLKTLKIASAFLTVIRSHLPDSGKN